MPSKIGPSSTANMHQYLLGNSFSHVMQSRSRDEILIIKLADVVYQMIFFYVTDYFHRYARIFG